TGCSTHSVPSWSNSAMRSSGGTKSLLAGSVVTRTKSRIARFAGPSFHEASGVVLWASAAVASRSPGRAGIAASAPSTRRRLRPSELVVDMMTLLLNYCPSLAEDPAFQREPQAYMTFIDARAHEERVHSSSRGFSLRSDVGAREGTMLPDQTAAYAKTGKC